MFNNIDELEREIQEFRDNIIASNELIQTLQDVIEALKGQSDDFKQSNKNLESEISTYLTEVKKLSYDTTAKLEADLKTSVDEVRTISIETTKAISDRNDEQIKKLVAELENTVTEIKASQAEQVKKLENTESKVNRASEELEKKYSDFLNRLETTNVDQIFQICAEMKKSLETKLFLSVGGVGIAVILMVISFFIK